MSENLFQILQGIIPVLGTIITCFIVPYIKANISVTKLEQYKEWASLAVKTAEMLWTETGKGSEKKQYAVDFLDGLFNAKKTVITQEQIQILIESAVRELQQKQ